MKVCTDELMICFHLQGFNKMKQKKINYIEIDMPSYYKLRKIRDKENNK